MSFTNFPSRIAVLAFTALVGLPAVAAAHDDSPAAETPQAPVPHADVMFAGATPSSTGMPTSVEFTNAGQQSGTAMVTLFDASTGNQLATWISPAIAPFGSLQVASTDIVAAATPALATTQAMAPINFEITSTFHGNAQLIGVAGGTPVDLGTCGGDLLGRILGNVAGPGNATFNDAVRIVNDGTQPAKVSLTIYSAADGSQLGTWTSPTVPAKGSLTTSVATIAAAATPAVPSTATLLTVTAKGIGGGVSVQHLSASKTGNAVTNLTSACRLTTPRAADAEADQDSDDNVTPNGHASANATAEVHGHNGDSDD